MQYVPLDGVSYLGLDMVPDVIARNRALFSSQARRFELFDAEFSTLPAADLLSCKDVLIHWPNDTIRAFLAATKGRYRWSLFVYDDQQSLLGPHITANADIELGGFRAVDLAALPFEVSGGRGVAVPRLARSG